MSTGPCVCGVLLCSMFLDFRPALAQTSQAQIELHFVDCASLDADAVHTLLGIELSAAQLDPAGIEITAACDDEHVTVNVKDNVVGELHRTLSWQGVQGNARSRLFSLAVAEMIGSTRREHEETTRQHLAHHSQISLVPSRADAIGPARPTLNTFTGVTRLGAHWSWAPTLGIGITRPWYGHDYVSLLMNLEVTQAWSSFQRGDVSLTSIGTNPRIQLHTKPARYQSFFHFGASLAFASVSGSSGDPAIDAQRSSALLWGPNVGVGFAINGARLQVGTSLSATWLVRPLHVRTVSGGIVVQDNSLAQILPTLNLLLGWR